MRVIQHICRPVAAYAIAILLFSGLCLAADFSATQTTTFGSSSVSAKLFVHGKQWRQETSSMGQQEIKIGRDDKPVSYTLHPDKKEYTEEKTVPRPWSASMTTKTFGTGMTRQSLGKGKLRGVTYEKYFYSSPEDWRGTITQYVDKALDLAVKSEIKSPQGTITIEYKNIKKVSQPALLFEIPKGYKKITPPAAEAPK